MKEAERFSKIEKSYDKHLTEATIDDILRLLIKDCDLEEVVCCLDMISKETGRNIIMMENDSFIYPAGGTSVENLISNSDFTSVDNWDKSNCTIFQEELPSVSDTYKGGFFKNRHRLSWRCNPVCQSLIRVFDLQKQDCVIDAGCAIGDYVDWFNSNGYLAWGIEGSEAAKEFIKSPMVSIQDLRKPLPQEIQDYGFALAYSLEVAEHIEEDYAGVYLDNLCKLSDTILITAAGPDQGGHGHVNCKPKGYWVALMKKRNYSRREDLEKSFINELSAYADRKEIRCYLENVMVFKSIHFTGDERNTNGSF